jgi:hypothetical protein
MNYKLRWIRSQFASVRSARVTDYWRFYVQTPFRFSDPSILAKPEIHHVDVKSMEVIIGDESGK